VSLDIGAGEHVGVIGLNGAGKSTLLKVLAGIYAPLRGSVTVEGHVCPLFEFATGFEMDSSGWDNIRTRALLLGMSPRHIEMKLAEIGQFTGLEEFLDYPVRCYSSGMLLRLAFATSTAVEPEILLLDEVMAAGDTAFIDQARTRMNNLMQRASIVVFASHSLDLLPHFCSRTIWLHHGIVAADGPTRDVIEKYLAAISPAAEIMVSV
jgi:lipopolysaccharide transport system ATP-binding protein